MVDLLYFNGCSFTHGDLLEQESCEIRNGDTVTDEDYSFKYSKRFSGLFGSYYNLPVINSASGGGSNDRILRVTISDVSESLNQGKKPYVIILWSHASRREFWDSSLTRYVPILNHDTKKGSEHRELASIIYKRYQDATNDHFRFNQQRILLQSFLTSLDIPYYFFDAFGLNHNDCDILSLDSLINQKRYGTKTLQNICNLAPKAKDNHHPYSQGHRLMFDYMQSCIKSSNSTIIN